MNREEALELVKKHLANNNLVNHSLAVEACMREFAEKFGEDADKWAMAGLLHDLDYDYTVDTPDLHTLQTMDLLASYNLDEDILHAIKAHNSKAGLDSKMDIALYTIDPTSGFITACALMHPSKQLENINLKRMKKRYKVKTFAKGASREQMEECTKMGVELEEFLVTCLTAMQKISDQLGL
ncbi:MAG: HDIG domain-containing protein [bacterium]|nr:HDIG domain-containing protein [bacterium]